MEAPHLYIYDPEHSGHHLRWIDWIARGASRFGNGLTFMCSAALLRSLDPKIVERAGVAPADFIENHLHQTGKWIGQLRRGYSLAHYLRQHGTRHEEIALLIAHLDPLLWGLPLLAAKFKGSILCIWLRPPQFKNRGFMDCARDFVKINLIRVALRLNPSIKIFTLELPETIATRLPLKYSQQIIQLDDPGVAPTGFSRAEARSEYGIPCSAKTVLLYGAISERKGLRNFIKLIGELDNAYGLIVGRQDDEARRIIADACAYDIQRNRLTIIDKLVSEIEEGASFAAADLIWLGYREFYGSSGVLVQAGLAGIPVIATQGGEIGRKVAAADNGLVLTDGSNAQFLVAELLNSPEELERMSENGRSYFAAATPILFANRVLAEVNRNATLAR